MEHVSWLIAVRRCFRRHKPEEISQGDDIPCFVWLDGDLRLL
jgi:hypothetical protein